MGEVSKCRRFATPSSCFDTATPAEHNLREAGVDGQPEVRPVGGDLDPVAVQDAPSRRRPEAEIELVRGRKGLVAVRLHELQRDQPAGHGQHGGPRQSPQQEGAPVERPLALVHLVKEDGWFHRGKLSAKQSSPS